MASLNFEKLSKSDFSNRLLDFVKDYGKVTNVELYDTVVDWFIEQKDYMIKCFLNSKPLRGVDSSLLDRKKALYEEFLVFYE